VRDSAFTIYAFIRLGFTDEADNFMKFIMKVMDERLECADRKQQTDFDLLPIMLNNMIIRLMGLGTVFTERRIWKKSS
jgi:GH15 family glucan-1,4-alpha-glucosidase